MRIEPRLRRLEQRRRNPYASDPRLAPLLRDLDNGRSLCDVADDGLELLIAWATHEYGPSNIDLAAMSDEELNAAIDGDTSFLERYRMATP
jgi:hypothetical protein